ncbi:hypothetical protein T492DRAFT_39836 [Pavlovales sp. CCMP2436]|nr:hypothetical protein T492DRAFT_39836 [Pavlovales sp. CCMP2436]
MLIPKGSQQSASLTSSVTVEGGEEGGDGWLGGAAAQGEKLGKGGNEQCGRGRRERVSFTCDIPATAERQGGFLWQVRWLDYDDDEFLADALRRYLQLLRLWAMHRNAFLVPTYDQDLMWHAHMVHPCAYARDCQTLCRRLIDHDDSVTDRSAGSRLSTGAEQVTFFY